MVDDFPRDRVSLGVVDCGFAMRRAPRSALLHLEARGTPPLAVASRVPVLDGIGAFADLDDGAARFRRD